MTRRNLALAFALALPVSSLLVACGGGEEPRAGTNSSSAPVEMPVTMQQTQTPPEPQAKVEPPKGTLDPCSLLTKADATAAIGEPAKDGEHPKKVVSDPLGIAICFFGAASPTSVASAQILVVQNGGIDEKVRKSGMNVKRIFEESKRLSDSAVKPVSGVGDDAFLNGLKIEVLKGDTHLSISMMRKGLAPATPETDAALTAMARTAVAHLGH